MARTRLHVVMLPVTEVLMVVTVVLMVAALPSCRKNACNGASGPRVNVSLL